MIPIGVTTKKNTIPITIGEIIFPKNKPNFIQNRLNGVRYFESKIPSEMVELMASLEKL